MTSLIGQISRMHEKDPKCHLDVDCVLVVGLALVVAGVPLHGRVNLHLGLCASTFL
jgi:hypothetical protein